MLNFNTAGPPISFSRPVLPTCS